MSSALFETEDSFAERRVYECMNLNYKVFIVITNLLHGADSFLRSYLGWS